MLVGLTRFDNQARKQNRIPLNKISTMDVSIFTRQMFSLSRK